jgi:uncharacterized membrane protein YesL
MANFFQYDNPVLVFLGKVLDSIILNLLWLACSIPVFTMGAATSALYYCTLKLAEGREVSLPFDFFREFRNDFKENWKANLFMLVCGILIVLDGYVFWHMRYRNAVWAIGTAVFVLLALIYAVTTLYVFPLMARFRNTWKHMIQNAFIIGIRFLIPTVIIALLHIAMALIIIRVFTPAVFLGEGFTALLSSFLLKKIFQMLEGSQNSGEAKEA